MLFRASGREHHWNWVQLPIALLLVVQSVSLPSCFLMALRLVLAWTAICLLLLVHTEEENRYDFQEKCLSFTPEAYVRNGSRQALEYIPAGTTLTLPYNDPTCARPSQVISADLCRVALSIPTSNRSSITYELWLPAQWSGRFLGTGNGGIDGCQYSFELSPEHERAISVIENWH